MGSSSHHPFPISPNPNLGQEVLKIHADINKPISGKFRSEVEIWPCRACAMKNMQYDPYLMAEWLKVLQEQFGHCGLGHGTDTTFHRLYL